MNKIRIKLMDKGIYVPKDKSNVAVSVSKLSSIDFNFEMNNNYFFKTYEESLEIYPFSLILWKRDPRHYLNVDIRISMPEKELKSG